MFILIKVSNENKLNGFHGLSLVWNYSTIFTFRNFCVYCSHFNLNLFYPFTFFKRLTYRQSSVFLKQHSDIIKPLRPFLFCIMYRPFIARRCAFMPVLISLDQKRFVSWPNKIIINETCNNFSILPKSSLKLISSTCSSFWLKTYLLCLVDVFFNRQSAYLWVQTVLLFSPTCFFIRMRQTSYRGFSRKTERS